MLSLVITLAGPEILNLLARRAYTQYACTQYTYIKGAHIKFCCAARLLTAAMWWGDPPGR
jgi:hypothetical protein